MNYAYLKFLNLEYWYCVIYSLFGGKCTTPGSLEANVGVGIGQGLDGASTIGTTTVTGISPPAIETVSTIGGFFHSFVDTLTFAVAVIGGAIALLWAIYSALAYTVSGILMMTIFSSLSGLFVIRYRELFLYGTLPQKPAGKHPLKSRWQALLDAAMTLEPKKWREGILEADVMLGELLAKLGYEGKTTGDQMRKVAEGAFVTLPAAWEAHRVSNFVAARSSDYILTQREAFRVMKLFEQVFEEFNFI